MPDSCFRGFGGKVPAAGVASVAWPAMDVTPQELRDIEIRESFRGYHRDDVDELLERAAATIEHLEHQIRILQERLASGPRRPARVRPAPAPRRPGTRAGSRTGAAPVPVPRGPDGDVIQRTLILAQRAADEAVAEAQARAAQVTGEAEAKAQAMVAEAESTARRIAETERRRIETEIAQLTTTPRRAQRRCRRARGVRGRVPRPHPPGDRGRARSTSPASSGATESLPGPSAASRPRAWCCRPCRPAAELGPAPARSRSRSPPRAPPGRARADRRGAGRRGRHRRGARVERPGRVGVEPGARRRLGRRRRAPADDTDSARPRRPSAAPADDWGASESPRRRRVLRVAAGRGARRRAARPARRVTTTTSRTPTAAGSSSAGAAELPAGTPGRTTR